MKIGRCILIGLLAGCGAADGTDTEHAPLPPVDQPNKPIASKANQAGADKDCPLALPGAQVASEVTADGVALVFTTGGGDAAELQSRVRRMADSHNAAQMPAAEELKGAEGEGGMTSSEGAHGMDMHGGARNVPSRAVVEDTAGGARIVFTPSDPKQVSVLREQIRVHGKEMATTGCAGEEPAPAQSPPPPRGSTKTPAEPVPTPSPQEPVLPDRPVTPDHPVTPPSAPPPPTGQPLGQ